MSIIKNAAGLRTLARDTNSTRSHESLFVFAIRNWVVDVNGLKLYYFYISSTFVRRRKKQRNDTSSFTKKRIIVILKSLAVV